MNQALANQAETGLTERFNVQGQQTSDLSAQRAAEESVLQGEQAGYVEEQIAQRGEVESGLIAEQAGFADARVAAQHGYSMEQLEQQGQIDRDNAAQLEKLRLNTSMTVQDSRNAAALDLADIEAANRQLIATNAAAAV